VPRRKDPSQARSVEISVFIREMDFDNLVHEASLRRLSLSRHAFNRIMATQPIPSEGNLALAKELGRLGNNLNQLIRLAHSYGFDSSTAQEAFRTVDGIYRRLIS
jgi:hypothetical protein